MDLLLLSSNLAFFQVNGNVEQVFIAEAGEEW